MTQITRNRGVVPVNIINPVPLETIVTDVSAVEPIEIINTTAVAVVNGQSFTANNQSLTVANGADFDTLIRTGSSQSVFGFSILVLGDFNTQFRETITVSATGVSVSIFNRNRNSTKTIDVTIFDSPTVTGIGTLLDEVFLPAGTRNSATTQGGESNRWILKPSTDYLVRMTNSSGQISSTNISMEFLI